MRYMFVCISSEAKSVHLMLKPYLWGTSHLFAPAECFLVSSPRNLRSASLIEYHNSLLLNSPFRGSFFPLSFLYPFFHKNQHTESFLLILCADFHCSLLTKWHCAVRGSFFASFDGMILTHFCSVCIRVFRQGSVDVLPSCETHYYLTFPLYLHAYHCPSPASATSRTPSCRCTLRKQSSRSWCTSEPY